MEPVNFFELIAHATGKLPTVVVGTWMVMALLIVFALAARRSLARAADPAMPDEGLTLRHFAEVIAEWLDGFVAQVSELHGARKYVPFFGSLFLFILTANFMGLIPGLAPPTNDTDLTFALGVICFVYYLYQGFAHQGPKYLLSFFGPLWWLAWFMVVIEVADNIFRPFSLGIRLFANMFADHHVLTLFTGLTYLVIPIAFYALGTIVCIVQALVFVILAISYVRMAAAAH
ncbi:MAG TPA: F0F1 ATP synthase subunit A [Candidatus Binataceae bacterium]|nr:F0F1 ATP synthase subunit A [Candidatus Binataceae bacterium]